MLVEPDAARRTRHSRSYLTPRSPTGSAAVRPCRRGPSRRASPHCCTPFASCSATAAISPRPRSTAPPVPTSTPIAVCFGTGRLYAILAHLQRGILRATALENVLLARAARGRDIGFAAPRERPAAAPPAPADPPATEQSAEAPVARQRVPRPSRPAGWNDPELFMPTLEELEAQVRRRPLGRTLVEICLDLAVVPGFCTGAFWNEVFNSIRWHGGSIGTLMLTKGRREKAFCREQDRKVGSNWDWQKLGREGLRRALGFCIGEAVDAPFDPLPELSAAAAALATGPP